MKIIFLKDYAGSKLGDVKAVSEGYARNFLIPRGVAEPATDKRIRELENLKRQKTTKVDQQLQKLSELSHKHFVLNFTRRADKAGTLFAGVSASDIARGMAQKTGMEFPEKWVKLPGHLKKVGEHAVDLDLGHATRATVTVKIISE